MDLLVWQNQYPDQALGIILSLLEKLQDDEPALEQVALGPVQQIVEWTDDSFTHLLEEAVQKHPLFEICTRDNRRQPPSPRWRMIDP